MDQLYLLARIDGQAVALPAAQVDSVVEVDGFTPVPRGPAHVAGLAPLRSRVLTVIDTRAALGLDSAPAGEGAVAQAAVVSPDGHLYGLLLDAVEDVATIPDAPRPLRSGLASGWARASSGVVEHEGRALLVLSPAALVAGVGAGPAAH